jgi:hypothetical protein
MNELLARLVDITYELVGVLIPGLIASVFLVLLLIAVQPLLAGFFGGGFCFDLRHAWTWLNSSTKDGTITFIAVLVGWYLLGQVLLSFSKYRVVPDARSEKSSSRRVLRALTFRIPRSPDSYDPKLEPLFKAVATKFNAPEVQLEWRQFYPVVRSYLAEHLKKSMITLYQNKYTLHRSITTASTVAFWLSILTCIGAGIGAICGITVNWDLLVGILVGSFLIAWSFSASFMLHWQLFGDSVVTEAYSFLYGPQK